MKKQVFSLILLLILTGLCLRSGGPEFFFEKDESSRSLFAGHTLPVQEFFGPQQKHSSKNPNKTSLPFDPLGAAPSLKARAEEALKSDDVCQFVRIPYELRDLPEGLSIDFGGRFREALFFAGLIEGAKPSSLNLELAASTLQELSEKDPENGAYPLYLSEVFALQGRSFRDQRDQILNAARASFFDTKMKSNSIAWMRQHAVNASIWLAVRSVFSVSSVPRFPSLRSIQKSLGETSMQERSFCLILDCAFSRVI